MNKQEQLLSREPIGKALFKLSIPAMIGMFVMALYNLVDTIFVGRGVGVLGIAGIAIVFPISMIIMSLAQMVGIGGSSIISRSLGAQDKDYAARVLGNMVTLVFGMGVTVMALGLIFLHPLLMAFGATDTILPVAATYGRITLYGTIFFSGSMAANSVIRSEGNAKMAMWSMLIGAVLNIILDPIFIFGFDMGIAGAAWATIVSQGIAFIYVVYYFVSKKSLLRITVHNLLLRWKIVKETIAIGISSFIRMVAGSVMTVIINHTLGHYGGDVSIATFGIINRLLSFAFMPMLGIVQGMQPLVGYNYGARHPGRVKHAIHLSLKIMTYMSIAAFVIFMLFPHPLLRMFTSDVELLTLGEHATRIISLFTPALGLHIVSAGMYQAMGRAWASFIISSLRQIIFFIPFVLILPLFFHLDGVWISFPAADVCALIVSWWMYKREMNLIEHHLA